MLLEQIVNEAIKKDASDVHLTVGLPILIRVVGDLEPLTKQRLTTEQMNEVLQEVLNPAMKARLDRMEDVDFAYQTNDKVRIRANIYKQRNSYAMALRILKNFIPTIKELELPDILQKLAHKRKGLILVTGPTGSGKSTTLAAMIDEINQTRSCHILTLEDPIEFIHNTKKSLVSQRELGTDLLSFQMGLKSALREDPDVILVGEMRDYETISLAITAAETGHLVLSTLHTTCASQTVERIIDVFPEGQQDQIRTQLAGNLVSVISQQLIKTSDGHHRCAALEILINNEAIGSLIRENKAHQIDTYLVTKTSSGMQIMDLALAKLVALNKITYDKGYELAKDKEIYKRYINNKIK